MPTTTDVRKTVLEQSKVALDEARKPWYAAVGVTDLAYDQIREQLRELPTEAQARLRRLQSGAGQVDAAHLRDAVETATSQARETYSAYVAQAREAYESLAHRGELVVRRLRRSEELRSAFDKAEDVLADAEGSARKAERTVRKAEEQVTRPGTQTTRKPAARKAPARRPATKA